MNDQPLLFSLPSNENVPVKPPKYTVGNDLLSQEQRDTTQDSIMALLNALFPEQQREAKEVKQAKAILGNLATTLNAEEIQVIIYEIQYLISSWTDMYERKILKGKTLQEILNEG